MNVFICLSISPYVDYLKNLLTFLQMKNQNAKNGPIFLGSIEHHDATNVSWYHIQYVQPQYYTNCQPPRAVAKNIIMYTPQTLLWINKWWEWQLKKGEGLGKSTRRIEAWSFFEWKSQRSSLIVLSLYISGSHRLH